MPKSVRAIVGILKKEGFEAYPVGGCVRDSLLGEEPKDWDVTTIARPEKVMGIFEAQRGYKVFPTGLKHGTVTVVHEGEPYEVTTFRTEGTYKDHRRPDAVEFTSRVEEDLRRRDFTVNAMAYDIYDEYVIDPYGGVSDLEKGLIRCVGNPSTRFDEDALRILRALRFSSVLGFEIEEDSRKSLVELRETLNLIAVERIKGEMDKLLLGQKAGQVLRGYHEVFSVFIPEIQPMVGFDQRNKHHSYELWEHTVRVVENTPRDLVTRWAALFHDMGKPGCFFMGEDGQGHFHGHNSKSAEIARDEMNRLHFDRDTKDRVVKLVKYHDTPLPTEEKYLKRYLNKLGEDDFFRLVDLIRADNLGQNPDYRFRQKTYDEIEETVRSILQQDECFSLKNLMVNGNDMLTLGFRGPEIGKTLKVLLEEVMDGKVENIKADLVEEARRIGEK